MFIEQYYTAKQLILKQEYNIEQIICSSYNLPYYESLPEFREYFSTFFPDSILGDTYFAKLKDFDTFLKYNFVYHNDLMHSGIYLCVIGAALGYKEIYLTGIDLYYGDSKYAFEVEKDNALKLAPEYKEVKNYNPDKSEESPFFYNTHHSNKIDLDTLEFLAKHYDIKFYALSPNSPITKYIPLAPQNGSKSIFEKKPKDSIKDILIPPSFTYERLSMMMHTKNPYENATSAKRYRLRDNIYYKIVKDFFRLPGDFYHYIKGRICKE